MATDGRPLSLGGLFHDLRAGLGDRGAVRVFIEFRLESTTWPVATRAGAAVSLRRSCRADLHYRDEILEQAHLVSTGLSPRPLADILITRREHRYLYSCDGERFGLLRDTPRLFDVYSVESHLNRVSAGIVNEEADPQPDGSPGRILRVAVSPADFPPLIRLFGDDPGEMAESLDVSGCSAIMTSGDGVGIHYRWQTSGEEIVDDDRGSGRRSTQHRSRVTIRLSPHGGIEPRVLLDADLPTLAGLDDVWACTRIPQGAAHIPGQLPVGVTGE